MTPATKPAPYQWNPMMEPWRVSRVYRTSAAGLYGWATKSTTFASREDAEAFAAEQLSVPRTESVTIDYAENADDWQRTGRWDRIRKMDISGRGRMRSRS